MYVNSCIGSSLLEPPTYPLPPQVDYIHTCMHTYIKQYTFKLSPKTENEKALGPVFAGMGMGNTKSDFSATPKRSDLFKRL
jgi:hypothetical protein